MTINQYYYPVLTLIMKGNFITVRNIYLKLLLFFISIGIITRIILLCNPQTLDVDFSFVQWIEIFFLGIINDASILSIAFVFMFLYLLSISKWKFRKPWNFAAMGVLVCVLFYLSFFNTIFDEYGAGASRIAIILISFWLLSFAFRNFFPKCRHTWTAVWFWIISTAYIGLIFFNIIAETAFWNEFGVRYNFIAVDYLVYTTEVVGNIFESYPMIPIIIVWFIVSVITTWLLFRKDTAKVASLSDGQHWKTYTIPSYLIILLASVLLLNFNLRFQDNENTYVNELQANGIYKFYDAFLKNELQFDKFYSTLPPEKAEKIIGEIYGTEVPNGRTKYNGGSENRPNIVLITLESMSADYMNHFGNTKTITPTLDSLYAVSLSFDSLYATGNRTVRGLEALTLSLPPCPGQSIVKQQNNTGLFTLGSLLRDKGYSTTYFYGGNAYFDNMEEFFGGNGYDIIDRSSYSPEEITFANIWGVCDEDAYNKALSVMDTLALGGQPFFAHMLSVSNHRPFTFPSGKIPEEFDNKSREGGVMYSDYALGDFLNKASGKNWFDNTVFVISADHCASSAGKTDIPLNKYHIPALIYSPALIEAQSINKVASQIDIIPTLFAALGMDYENRFYGRDVRSEDYVPRAFVATYQDLGYLENDTLTVLSPVKKIQQYRLDPLPDNPYNLSAIEDIDTAMADRATALYQYSR